MSTDKSVFGASAFAALQAQYLKGLASHSQELSSLLEFSAFARGDPESRFRLLAHGLKGSGGSYGFPQITALGAGLEAAYLASVEPRVLLSLIASLNVAITSCTQTLGAPSTSTPPESAE